MIATEIVKVLLVEDDEDDYIIARDLFAEMPGTRFLLDWAKTFEQGLEVMALNQHDVCLLDYRLGAQNGIELLRKAVEAGCQSPVIVLTGMGEHKVDLEAMEAGAADYLIKARLQGDSLERAVRYALQRKRAAAHAAFEQARLAAFGSDVGLALTRRDALNTILDRCARAMAQYLNAAIAQIATFESPDERFEARATAGSLVPSSAPSGFKAPTIQLDTGALREGKPVVTGNIPGVEPGGPETGSW